MSRIENLHARITGIKAIIELYKLTPDKEEYDMRTDSFIRREDLLPSYIDALPRLEKELKEQYEQRQ